MPIDSFLTEESQPNERSLPLQVIYDIDNKEVLEQTTEQIKLHEKIDKLFQSKIPNILNFII